MTHSVYLKYWVKDNIKDIGKIVIQKYFLNNIKRNIKEHNKIYESENDYEIVI